MRHSFPNDFIKLSKELFGDASEQFINSLDTPSPVSVRWNPYKLQEPAPGTPVPWNRYGRYLEERPSFTADPLFHGGLYYVQEASSMFIEHIVRSCSEYEGARILDLCAAPGGKATLYSTLAGPEGIVIANEVIRSRASVLADNARKWGVGNIVVTNNDPSHFDKVSEWFDIVAVDAPCSGEGMFRKNPEARNEWSLDNVAMCAARQRRIISDAWESLAPGGLFIYSTCTFNRSENEDNVLWMTENFDCEDAGLTVPDEWNIEQTESGGIKCFRFRPDMIRGEGFFTAAIIKCGQKGRPVKLRQRKQIFSDVSRQELTELSKWVGQPEYMQFAHIGDNIYGFYEAAFQNTRTIAEHLNTLHSGVCMGQLYGNKLKPEHSLALFHDINRDAVNIAELDIDNAIRFLSKEDIADMSLLKEGLNLISYKSHPVGWAKRIGQRVNNLYPKSLMILNRNR